MGPIYRISMDEFISVLTPTMEGSVLFLLGTGEVRTELQNVECLHDSSERIESKKYQI